MTCEDDERKRQVILVFLPTFSAIELTIGEGSHPISIHISFVYSDSTKEQFFKFLV